MQEILTKAGCYIAIILLGIILRRSGFFKAEDFTTMTKIVLRITLPASIIASTAGKTVDPSMLSIVLLGLGGGVVYMVIAYLTHRKSTPDQRAFAVLNTPGYNIGTFAMPFTQSFLGSTGVLTTSLFDVGNACVCLGGAYGVAAAVKDGKGFDIQRIVKALSRSIPFLTYVSVLVLNLLRIRLPGPVIACAGIVGSANPFMAMLMIGTGFQLSGDFSQRGTIVRILGLRFGVAALLALGFYFLLPFELEVRQTLVILAFSPIGSAVPGFTAGLKGDAGLSSAITSISILISIVIIVTLLVVML
jgi:predicted permease